MERGLGRWTRNVALILLTLWEKVVLLPRGKIPPSLSLDIRRIEGLLIPQRCGRHRIDVDLKCPVSLFANRLNSVIKSEGQCRLRLEVSMFTEKKSRKFRGLWELSVILLVFHCESNFVLIPCFGVK